MRLDKTFRQHLLLNSFLVTMITLWGGFVKAHEPSATYLANESVLVTNGNSKVLFDPFFHNNYGQYQLVPAETLKKVFAGQAPFDDIDAIVISHAHGDHFAADEVLRYLSLYPKTKLVAPQQAIDELRALTGADKVSSQLYEVKLAFNQAPQQIELGEMVFEGVRIPHAGWPGRADIENIVFRVTLSNTEADKKNENITVMHMGDADANDDHYLPFKAHWQSRETDLAFPPYWFFYQLEGNYILDELINAKQHVGVHVPMQVPKRLKETGKDYFSKSGEQRTIKHEH
ncbi:MBL fold metallo-hydrolase [Glaciecola petra]|uniref:MBL fold metallo-hydrolase n=1 Tax=Glaciecola petra TaxID=3075602 RepID=A0ABU2ZXT1_9ALTE|nr:MBL fold metallo-hydrolase [Aestuariibacter sp. P117]MDT0596374.1 MBL fold metallo-hydrolase [Aestuariibacter sp. P117]